MFVSCVLFSYSLMMDCWCVAPGRRPSFMDLINRCHLLMDESEKRVSCKAVERNTISDS